MISKFRWPQPQSSPHEKLVSDVRQYGCHVIRVFAESPRPDFAYSIGLYLNYRQPEVIVFGLPADTAQAILNNLRQHAAEGRRFVAGDRSDLLLTAHDVCFTEVPLDAYPEYLGFARWFYRSLPEPFPAVQLVWPDREGRFPWEPGHDRAFDAQQPVLSRPA